MRNEKGDLMNKLLNKAAVALIDTWQDDSAQRRGYKRQPMLSDFVEHLEDTMPEWWLAHFFQRDDSEELLERALEKVIVFTLRHAS